jgi:crotonobetainyl-CoA:carnitine CoA-transferase CaiB-like acyl-CoA transferase
MLMEIPRPEGGEPVLTPGNPIKMSRVSEGPDVRMPWLGEHTNEVLAEELGLDTQRIDELRQAGVIA